MTDLRTRACQFIIREAAHHNDGCEPALLVKELVGALDTIDRLEGKLAWHEDQMAQVPEEAWNLHGSSDPDA